MDPQRLRELASDIRELLKAHKVPVQIFTLKILVPPEYYQEIKHNFRERHPIDVILGSAEEDWSIDIVYPYRLSSEVKPDHKE